MANDQHFRPLPDDEGQDALESIDQLHAAADRPDGAAPFQISGNIPPQFAAKMRAAGQQQQPASPLANMQKKGFNEHGFRQVRGGSDQLKTLIAHANSDTHIYEPVRLPSGGRFYDGTDGPMDGVLHVREMTGQEEQILATPRFVRKGQAVNMIFQKCIQENFNPENFLTIDRTYLLIFLRIKSHGPEYQVELKCPDTDKKFPATIDLNTLFVENCPDDFGPVLQDKLPNSGFNFTYRLSRGRDERELQEYRERRIQIRGEESADDSLIHRTATLVNEIEGLEDPEEIEELLKHLSIKDVTYLRNVINEPPFGIETSVPILSPFTDEEFQVELPLEANFFFPRRKKAK